MPMSIEKDHVDGNMGKESGKEVVYCINEGNRPSVKNSRPNSILLSLSSKMKLAKRRSQNSQRISRHSIKHVR